MNDRTYNGWTNKATWLVNVWFNPESLSDVQSAREALQEAEDAIPDYLRDFLCTDEIDWSELEEHFEEKCTHRDDGRGRCIDCDAFI